MIKPVEGQAFLHPFKIDRIFFLSKEKSYPSSFDIISRECIRPINQQKYLINGLSIEMNIFVNHHSPLSQYDRKKQKKLTCHKACFYGCETNYRSLIFIR